MHVAQEETHIHSFDQVEQISKCHLTARQRAPRDKCLHGARGGWRGLDLPEWGNMEETLGHSGKGKVCCGVEGVSKGGCEAWRRASCRRLASVQSCPHSFGTALGWETEEHCEIRFHALFSPPAKSAKYVK